MRYWNSVLNEVLHKDDTQQQFIFTNRGSLHEVFEEEKILSHDISLSNIKRGRPKNLKEYFLGPQFPGIYLTKREADCMFLLVQDMTIVQTAEKLGLSARTVEFYVKNLKFKLHCGSKKQLIQKILQSTLLAQLAEVGVRVERH